MIRIEPLLWAILGLAAAFVLWFVSTGALMLVGFSFYSVIAGPILALVISASLAIALPKRWEQRNPDAVRYRLVPFLAGMLFPTIAIAAAIVLTHA